MSHYDKILPIAFTGLAILAITLPIWIVPWSVWYLIKGKKEEEEWNAIYERKEAERKEANRIAREQKAAHIPQEPWSKEKMEERANELVKKGDIEPAC